MVVRAVLFDLDDTLYDHSTMTRVATAAAVAESAALRAVPLERVVTESHALLEALHPDVVAKRLSLADSRVERYRRLLAQFGGDPGDAARLASVHVDCYRGNERLVPGARELLARLHALELPLAIVSNNTRDEQLGKLSRLHCLHFFSEVIVLADHAFAKPDPRLFEVALRKLGVSANAAVYVGNDWSIDVIGAAAAGIRPAWFNRFSRTREDSTNAAELTGFEDLDLALRVILER